MINSIISIAISIVLLISSLNTANSQEKADAIIGKWYTTEKDMVTEIFKKNSKYYGKIIWMQEPNDKNGNPKRDINNPNENLRDRTIVGIMFIKNFSYDGDNKYLDGVIYNFRDGNDYNAVLTLKDINTLEVRGYLVFYWLGKTVIWTRKK